MFHVCSIVPDDVLERFSSDPSLSEEIRRASENTALVDSKMRDLREQAAELTKLSMMAPPIAALAAAPSVEVYDCQTHQTLPGKPVSNPGSSTDPTVSRASKETTAVADFYKQVFGRNSIDNAGMTMLSSVHYGVKYNNAMWNGSQMVYGDGDNQIFTDFTAGNDVIGHELTHGVTQYTLQLAYSGDAGGLNESLSDCFGSMFRQWRGDQDAASADWLIGHNILGPAALGKGYNCLRNMADPADAKALSPQPTHYSQITPGMDPHYSSGPPNFAFYKACKAVGGKSWEKVGRIWYDAMVARASPNMKMKDFADRTRHLAVQSAVAVNEIDQAWKDVGL